jgi:hypothetical protein
MVSLSLFVPIVAAWTPAAYQASHAGPQWLRRAKVLVSEPSDPLSSEPSDPRSSSDQFKWGQMDAFQGDRVAELKRRQREQKKGVQLANVLRNLKDANPGTLLLIGLFVPLTFADIFFNLSRGFICSLPDLCDPMLPDG